MATVGALAGLTVLDLSHILAGPYCTQVLSDLGATVWKVEPPWGDDTRRFGPPFAAGESAYYLYTNRGKKSVVINLKDPRGPDLVRRLARKADVLVENFKSGDLARYRLDYESLAQDNPRLVYASITGFGHTGPRAGDPGVDMILQAMTGVMGATGEPDGQPMRVGVAWVDLLAGQMAAIGILAAVRERDRSGKGQSLDMSLFEAGLASMANIGQSYLLTGVMPKRLGNAHPHVVPYQPFEARDGQFILAAVTDSLYRRTTEAIGHPELWDDERFQTNAGRVEHREDLVPRLAEVFRKKDTGEWVETLAEAGVPATPIYDVAGALRDAQSEARRVTWDVPHPTIGNLPLLASPLQHMSRTPAAPQGHPPLLGEHTREVLADALGLGDAELASLERDGVIASRPKQSP